MLSEDARKDRYLAQTGRKTPTARQRRRINKMARRHSPEALVRRDHAVRVRMFAAVERNRRKAALAPSS